MYIFCNKIFKYYSIFVGVKCFVLENKYICNIFLISLRCNVYRYLFEFKFFGNWVYFIYTECVCLYVCICMYEYICVYVYFEYKK